MLQGENSNTFVNLQRYKIIFTILMNSWSNLKRLLKLHSVYINFRMFRLTSTSSTFQTIYARDVSRIFHVFLLRLIFSDCVNLLLLLLLLQLSILKLFKDASHFNLKKIKIQIIKDFNFEKKKIKAWRRKKNWTKIYVHVSIHQIFVYFRSDRGEPARGSVREWPAPPRTRQTADSGAGAHGGKAMWHFPPTFGFPWLRQ